ncbi:glycoside hydrolase, family 3-like protein [Rubrobacter xylanophilus DSM 9941]|uniref:Glycoside hydrolase, family 3-like protein n=2 Tax=Rubrobacter xylanophilus TaxID=49319 RepID=Q1AUI8_RUBXD|nr:glycoside hydrolase, family 3-like protein [Rubrobacter xylanophilus DSM 9941]
MGEASIAGMCRPRGALRAAALLGLLLLLAGCSGGAVGGEARDPGKPAGGEDPVGEMSVREMVGQMFVVSLGGTRSDYYIEKMVRERNVGGVLLFGYNMRSLPQVRRLTGELQRLSMATEPAVPLLVAVDQEGGEVQSAPWVSPQPSAAEIGASGDPEAARRVARRIGSELLEAGVNTDLAPVVDTGFGAAIGSRSYGENPELVSRMGSAAVEGFREAGVISAAKHFPNHGPATSDSHTGLPIVDHDMDTVLSRDLPPFAAAVRAGVPMVMVGHLLYPAIDQENPASMSPQAIRLLRERLGFDGVVITDDLAMAGARQGGSVARAAVRAVSAGADMLIVSSPPPQQAEAYDALVRAVRSGGIPERQVRASVRRIVEMKEDYNLYARH